MFYLFRKSQSQAIRVVFFKGAYNMQNTQVGVDDWGEIVILE